MAAEFQLFKPRKYADASEWKLDLQVKVDSFTELAKAGSEKSDDLQYFLSELVWSVVRGELTAARAVEFLSKTTVPSRETLQRVFADVLWLVGFVATEAPPDRSMRDEFHSFCSSLEKEGVLPRPVLALSLETESVPPAVCQVVMLKKKHNQAKTKARYTITRYNLLREHSEGYAKLIVLLDRLANLGFEPEAGTEQLEQARASLVEDIVRLAGFGHLCPNRILSMALDIYEKKLVEGDPMPLVQPLLSLMRRLPAKRLNEVVVFQLLAHAPAPSSGRDARPQLPHPPPSRPSQFLAVATLIHAGLLDLDVLWSYLDPSDAALKQAHTDLMAKYDDEVSALSRVDLGSSSTVRDRNSFGRAFQAFNQAGHQKFRLVAALISVNSWSHAHKALLHLQRICKPCLNHHVRSALCDLIKWLIGPLLRSAQKRSPYQTKPTLDTSYACMRCFELGLGGADSEVPNDDAGSGGLLGGLQRANDFEQLIPQLRQVLEHLEYFLHTDLHLLVSLWRVLFNYLRQREKASSGGVVLDDTLVAVVYRHLLPAASLVPHNPQLSDLMWSVMSQLSVFQRFLIYSCWETMYEGFLLKLVYEKTKGATKQILKRVVANAERRDLIAHQSHFHVCKLCHSNPIPAIETKLRDVEIGFNVNMIQPYVECTNRCPEMTADVMGFVLTRSCAKPTSANRAFLSQADATLSPWLVNLGEFVGRFYKKHPHTDLHGLLSVITRRINSEAVETATQTPGCIQAEYKGESLIRVILEHLIEFMGGYLTVADMNAEQLYCLAGGPRLKSESIAVGKKEDSSRKERARQALFNALVDLGLVPVLWFSLCQQRNHFLSEEFSEAHGGAGGLKLLGLLFDGNHECLLKLTEFLAQACSRDKYMSLVPSLQQVFSMFEPALAFLAIRHGLAPYGRALPPASPDAAAAVGTPDTSAAVGGAAPVPATSALAASGGAAPVPATTAATTRAAPAQPGAPSAPSPEPVAVVAAPAAATATASSAAATAAGPLPAAETAASAAVADAAASAVAVATSSATGGCSNGTGPVDPAIAEEEKTIADLEKVVRSFLPSIESDGLSMQFYITFWRLSLQDIFTPTDGYEKAIAQISTNIKQIEVSKKGMERDRDHTHSRDYKALKKEGARLQDFHSKLKEEQLAQAYNHQKVMARLKREKKQWFLKPSPLATSAFVAEMICPRVLTSYSDALFCSHFVRLLIKLKTPGFQLLDFYNSWTVMLTQCIRCCSEREAQIFGVFLREMMSYVLQLRRDENACLAEMRDNPCFLRNYYEDPNAALVEWTQVSDIRKGHSKWEGRIFKAMRQGLESEDWMEKRNALLLLSQCYEAFPVVEKYARAILASVEHMRDKEELSDVKTLATSLAVKLKGRREHWVDKGVQETVSARDHGRRGTEDRRPKNPLPTQDAPPPERRLRREGIEEVHGAERHETKADIPASAQSADRLAKEVREPKEHKEPKDSKEPKDGKPRERPESKAVRPPEAPKESRESKEARAADKESKRLAAREKDLVERQPRVDKDLQSSDRKRSSGTSSSTPAPAAAHLQGDRGSDRAAVAVHPDERPEKRRRTERDGYSSGGHQPRNALTSAPEPTGSASQYHRSGPTSGSSHDYRRSGYPSHTSGHSGGRYDAHRRRG